MPMNVFFEAAKNTMKIPCLNTIEKEKLIVQGSYFMKCQVT